MVSKDRKIILFSRKKRSKKVKSNKKRPPVLRFIIMTMLGLYCTAIFSNVPFIKMWRDLYIETAMDTYSHKWLATFIIPSSVIDGVMSEKATYVVALADLQSSWAQSPEPSASAVPSSAPSAGDLKKTAFLSRFNELNPSSFDAYIVKNPSVMANGYDKLLINKTGANDKGTTITTKNGDQVVVLDAENGILIVRVSGNGYAGKLAIIKNPAQVRLAVSASLGSYGQLVGQLAKDNHAVLAINASGFADPEWKGDGGDVVGLLIANGKTLNNAIGNGYMSIGFSEANRLYIGISPKQIKYRDAVEFMPPLIINGKNVTDGSTGFGIQPRTTIGQASDGTVLLLTIDGRQVGYSLGTTVGVCADILHKYGAVQASNLDGGSSTIMIYRDQIITKPSSVTNEGRYVPDAFIVDYANNVK